MTKKAGWEHLAIIFTKKQWKAVDFLLRQEKEMTVKEIIKISDDIEAEKETTVEEWKAFKALRNYLRDNYLKEGEK